MMGFLLKNAESLTLLCLTFSVLSAERPRFELGIRFWRIHAFQYCKSLTAVSLPEGLTTIPSYSFSECASLTSIIIPSTVTNIGGYAFYQDSKLAQVTCKATTPPTCESSAFSNISSSCVLRVPAAALSAYQAADVWKNFSTIEAAYYDFAAENSAGVTIYYNILDNDHVAVTYKDTSYASYTGAVAIPETVTYDGRTYTVSEIGNHAFIRSSGLTSVTIPSTVTTIGSGAFNACTSLKKVEIPQGVTEIKDGVFRNCSALATIYLPSTLTSLDDFALATSALSKIYLHAATVPTATSYTLYNVPETCALYVPGFSMTAYQSANYWKALTVSSLPYDFTAADSEGVTFYYKAGDDNTATVTYRDNRYASYSGDLTVPTSTSYGSTTYAVTAIGKDAFNQSSSLTSLQVPSGVTSIGDNALWECTKLSSVTLPQQACELGSSAFYGCKALTTVDLPSDLKTIPSNLFDSCTGLTHITLPASVDSLSTSVFAYCKALVDITVQATIPPAGATKKSDSTFNSFTKSACTLHVPAGSVTSYMDDEYWTGFNQTIGQPIYIIGATDALGQWDIANAKEISCTPDTDTYSYTIDGALEFKLSSASDGESWETFNSASWYNPAVPLNTTVDLIAGDQNTALYNYEGDCELSIDWANKTIIAAATPAPAPENIYVIGLVNYIASWYANYGVALTKDGSTFEGEVHLSGPYFGLATQLGSSSEDWDGLNAHRLKPVVVDGASDGFISLTAAGSWIGYGDGTWKIDDWSAIEEGSVKITVDWDSQTVTIEQGETGIEAVDADTLPAGEVLYYNLQGARITNPTPGQVYIRVIPSTPAQKILF
ncbi:MAG: leucine-rich repeat domain-containing protein [Bacteroidales bacterium]|nr:leucine-rich repeat domain-containing protein [Bacteroidales bacterium]